MNTNLFRRAALFALALILTFTLVGPLNTAPAAAQSDRLALARFMPTDTAIFFSLRVDDGYVSELDAVLQKIISKLPPGAVPPISLKTQIDQLLSTANSALQTDVRSWLGGHIAIGVAGINVFFDRDRANDADAQVIIAVEITDKAKAEAAIDSVLKLANLTEQFTKSGTDAITYETQNAPIEIMLMGDALLLGTKNGVRSTLQRDAKLNTNAAFTEAFALLPANPYNINVYTDPGAIFRALPPEMLAQAGLPEPFRALYNSPMGLAIGLTILDGRSLVIDTASYLSDPTAFAGLGMGLNDFKPVDATFADLLPANTVASVHLSNLNGFYDALISTIRLQAGAMNLSEEDINRQLGQIGAAFKFATGLELKDEFLSWMTEDFALFMSATPTAVGAPSLARSLVAGDQTTSLAGIGMGLLVKVTDPAKAANAIAKMGDSFTNLLGSQQGVTVTKGEGQFTLALTAPGLAEPVEIVFGANDKVFVIATKAEAEMALAGKGGFMGSAGYTDAAKYILPNAVQVWYLGPEAVVTLGDLIAASNISINRVFRSISSGLEGNATPTPDPNANARELAQFEAIQGLIRQVAGIFSSTSISANTAEKGGVSRTVLSLAE